MKTSKVLVMLFAGLLSPLAGAAETLDIPAPCFDSKQVVGLLNKSKAKKVASELTQEKDFVIIDSVWYDKDSILVLKEFKNQGITCILAIVNHKPQL
jgi:hypothetical protein